MSQPRHKSFKQVLAGVVTALLVAAGSLIGIAAPASAADAPSLSVTEAPRAGGTVTVTGSGFKTTGTGVYLSIRPDGENTNISTVHVKFGNTLGETPEGATAPMEADGSFSVGLAAPALAEGTSYVVRTLSAHGQGDETQNLTIPLPYAADTSGGSDGGSDEGGSDVGGETGPGDGEGSGEGDGSGEGEGSGGDGDESGEDSGEEDGENEGSEGSEDATPAIEVFLADGVTPAGMTPLFSGDTIVVKGTGFEPSKNISTRQPITVGDESGNYVVFGNFAENWRPSAEMASSQRSVGVQKWALPQTSLDNVASHLKPFVQKDFTPLSEDGSFETKIVLKAASAAPGSYGVFSYVAGGGTNDVDQELEVRLNYQGTPAISVFLEDGTTPYTGQVVETGDKFVVRGTGFGPSANIGGSGRPIPANTPQGTYVAFGKFADQWKPSSGAASSARTITNQQWALSEDVLDLLGDNRESVESQWVEITSAGTFEATLTVSKTDVRGGAVPAAGNWGVYTYGAGGVTSPDQELTVPVTYFGAPAIAVYLEDGVTPYTDQEVTTGDKLVVKGNGFDPASNVGGSGIPIPADQPQGAFAVFGNFAENWKPSELADRESRTMNSESRAWALAESVLDEVPAEHRPIIEKDMAALAADGTFSATITLLEPDEALEDGNWGIYTYAAGVGTTPNAAQELAVLVNFVPAVDEGAGDGEDEGALPGEGDEDTRATGELLWAFLDSWNGYLAMFGGDSTVLNGATEGTGGVIGYTQVPGGDYDSDTGLGTIQYQGTVLYEVPSHGIKIAFANPWIEFTADGARLSAEVSESDTDGLDSPMVRIVFAELNDVDPAENEDGSLTWTAVGGTMVDDLQPEGWEQYAGRSIAPVTFTFGAAEEAPASPAAVGVSSAKVKQGETIVFTGSGFEPGAAVTATVHSDPIVIGTKNANDLGMVEFSWKVPANFATGAHEIHLVSGDTTAVGTFTVERAAVTTTPGATQTGDVCVARTVAGGSLNWGLKSSFSSYVRGPIAGGTYNGGSFAAAGGAINAADGGIGRANFSGAITASGHGGLLNFNLSNPSIQITGPGTGVLFAHVASTKTDGSPAMNGTVAFANLSFSGPVISGDTLGVTGASATLTGAGATGFGGFYDAGTALDPVSFSVTLGGDVACDNTTDPELAATGADSMSAGLGFAVLALMLGAGLLLSARRRGALVQR